MPSLRAQRACAEWLAFCLKIGWAKSKLDKLEVLWWKYHDEQGKLIDSSSIMKKAK